MTDHGDRSRGALDARDVHLRTGLGPGDAETILRFHCDAYAKEFGFDPSFEEHVAKPLAEFASSRGEREQVWIAEHHGAIVGCAAIVQASPDVAQLRWFLVAQEARGFGLGRRLLDHSIRFCESAGYRLVILWTVNALTAAARLYREFGFVIVEINPARLWGQDLVEEKYELALPRTAGSRPPA